jgi:hypothetical protein
MVTGRLPHSTWARGTNVNTNRLIRRYPHKGTAIPTDQGPHCHRDRTQRMSTRDSGRAQYSLRRNVYRRSDHGLDARPAQTSPDTAEGSRSELGITSRCFASGPGGPWLVVFGDASANRGLLEGLRA